MVMVLRLPIILAIMARIMERTMVKNIRKRMMMTHIMLNLHLLRPIIRDREWYRVMSIIRPPRQVMSIILPLLLRPQHLRLQSS